MLVLTLLITAPLGVAGGIYMAEYAGQNRLTYAIRFSQELISSVPSIVVGLFGLALFVNATHWGYTALAGSLALTVFNLPLLSRLTEQAIRAVPAGRADGSLALGATKWQTIRHVVLPLAIPGIVTGIVLTAGRIFGEAAALIFTPGLSTPTGYDFGNLNLADSAIPVESVPPGDDAVHVHLQAATPRASGRPQGAGSPTRPRPLLVVPGPGVQPGRARHRPGAPAAGDGRMSLDPVASPPNGATRCSSRQPERSRSRRAGPAAPAADVPRPTPTHDGRGRRPGDDQARGARPVGLLRGQARGQERVAGHRLELRHRPDRSVRVRQVHDPALLRPHERPGPGRAGRGHRPPGRRGHLCARRPAGRGPAARRHGVPAAEPLPDVDL